VCWPNFFSHLAAFNYNGHWSTTTYRLAVELFYSETRTCSLFKICIGMDTVHALCASRLYTPLRCRCMIYCHLRRLAWRREVPRANRMPLGLHKIFVHVHAFVNKSIILLLPPPPVMPTQLQLYCTITAQGKPPRPSFCMLYTIHYVRWQYCGPLRANPVKKIPISKSRLKLATPVETAADPG